MMQSCYRDILKTIELKLEYITDLRKSSYVGLQEIPHSPSFKKKNKTTQGLQIIKPYEIVKNFVE